MFGRLVRVAVRAGERGDAERVRDRGDAHEPGEPRERGADRDHRARAHDLDVVAALRIRGCANRRTSKPGASNWGASNCGASSCGSSNCEVSVGSSFTPSGGVGDASADVPTPPQARNTIAPTVRNTPTPLTNDERTVTSEVWIGSPPAVVTVMQQREGARAAGLDRDAHRLVLARARG